MYLAAARLSPIMIFIPIRFNVLSVIFEKKHSCARRVMQRVASVMPKRNEPVDYHVGFGRNPQV